MKYRVGDRVRITGVYLHSVSRLYTSYEEACNDGNDSYEEAYLHIGRVTTITSVATSDEYSYPYEIACGDNMWSGKELELVVDKDLLIGGELYNG